MHDKVTDDNLVLTRLFNIFFAVVVVSTINALGKKKTKH